MATATSESAFINDIKDIAVHNPAPEGRRKAAEARFRRLERELERKFEGYPDADAHIAHELADLRRAMLIELERDPPATVGSLFDAMIRLTRKPRPAQP
jgi:hypothetical protein